MSWMDKERTYSTRAKPGAGRRVLDSPATYASPDRSLTLPALIVRSISTLCASAADAAAGFEFALEEANILPQARSRITLTSFRAFRISPCRRTPPTAR